MVFQSPAQTEKILEPLERDLLDLLTQLDTVYVQTKKDAQVAKDLFDALNVAIGQTEESWSGSWIGYHADLYFGDFERPGRGSHFNIEWGGIHGIPEGWRDRSYSEVSQHIEALSKSSIAPLEKLSKEVHNRVRPLYQDAQALITPILENAGETSKGLLENLQNVDWGTSQAAYLSQVRPSQLVSRDSRAVAQGMKVPPHIAFRAKAVSEYSQVTASIKALEQAMLGLKQARIALKITPRAINSGSTGRSSQSRTCNWLLILLITVVAVETFVLIRPYAITWFDTTFTQDFLAQPTRFGFSWGDIIANALVTIVIALIAWLAGHILKRLTRLA